MLVLTAIGYGPLLFCPDDDDCTAGFIVIECFVRAFEVKHERMTNKAAPICIPFPMHYTRVETRSNESSDTVFDNHAVYPLNRWHR